MRVIVLFTLSLYLSTLAQPWNLILGLAIPRGDNLSYCIGVGTRCTSYLPLAQKVSHSKG